MPAESSGVLAREENDSEFVSHVGDSLGGVSYR
jgi:hypothetical protein